MRKFTLFNVGILLLFALVARVEASVQIGPMEPLFLCQSLDSLADGEVVPVKSSDFGSYAAYGMPRLMIDACVGLGPRGITLCDLAEAVELQRRTLPEPATLAVWSLIGLCWSGVSCWRRKRGPVQNRLGWDAPRMRRRMVRPPWPDHVRARILEIIERGAPQ